MQTTIKFLLVSLLTIGLFSSCGDDEETCDPETLTLSSAIVGSWSISSQGANLGEVEFLADGTLVDPNGVMISGEINGMSLDDKSYRTTGNETLSLRAESGSNFQESELPITSFGCDEILAQFAGRPITFTRR